MTNEELNEQAKELNVKMTVEHSHRITNFIKQTIHDLLNNVLQSEAEALNIKPDNDEDETTFKTLLAAINNGVMQAYVRDVVEAPDCMHTTFLGWISPTYSKMLERSKKCSKNKDEAEEISKIIIEELKKGSTPDEVNKILKEKIGVDAHFIQVKKEKEEVKEEVKEEKPTSEL